MSPTWPADVPERFAADGFIVLRGFYDPRTDIVPIHQGIRAVIAAVGLAHGVDVGGEATLPFDAGLTALARADRGLVGAVYDGVKQLGAFIRLVADERNEALFTALRGGTGALAGGGTGIRIDLPGEEAFAAGWHQEFPAQLRSRSGVVFWAPLRDVDDDLGPVRICAGSHREGVVPVEEDRTTGQSGAYALRLREETTVVGQYPQVAEPVAVGDLVVMDFLTIHRSGVNRSSLARWTMQSRWFDITEPAGAARGWPAAYASGRSWDAIEHDLAAWG